MKRTLAFILALGMLLLCGCTAAPDSETLARIDALEARVEAAEAAAAEAAAPAAPAEAGDETIAEDTFSGELIVFAAASLTETLTQLGESFMQAHPDVTVVFNFDSSGTLKTQIEEGADCDVFISAAPKQMNQLDITADPQVNVDGLDYVLKDTRFDMLENKVVLAVPEGNPGELEGYDDLAERLAAGDVFLAMGNEDVPVGQYTQKILAYYGLDETALAAAGCITYGSNVKEVTTQVSEAVVDGGIIYATDAFSAGLTVVDEATADMCGQVIYPAAVLNIAKNEEAARAFLAFCTGAQAAAVFEGVGFTVLS